MLALRSGVRHVVAVESDLSWLVSLRHKAASVGSDTAVVWRHEDIGPTGDWGAPVDDSAWRHYQDYPLGVWRDGELPGGPPDLVVVDGRFRVACVAAVLLHAPPGTVVLLDDYTDRPEYHVLDDIVAPVAIHDQVAEFVVPATLDRDATWDLLTRALTWVR